MENNIKDKLNTILSKPIKKEMEVVYILVEIRKLLERVDDNSEFQNLKFYCSWVLHAEMNDPSLLREIENKIKDNRKKVKTIRIEMVLFRKFRQELIQFLSEQGLSNQFSNEDYWNKFKKEMIKVINECPLKPNDSYRGPIDKIVYLSLDEDDSYTLKIVADGLKKPS